VVASNLSWHPQLDHRSLTTPRPPFRSRGAASRCVFVRLRSSSFVFVSFVSWKSSSNCQPEFTSDVLYEARDGVSPSGTRLIRVTHGPDGSSADAQRARDLAWAEALSGLGRVALTLSSRLRSMHDAPTTSADSTVAAPPDNLNQPGTPPLSRSGLGQRQESVLALGGLDTESGMATTEVANAVGYARTNTHRLLGRLAEHGLLEQVPDERPVRWRRASG
jgi:hypothetical protein